MESGDGNIQESPEKGEIASSEKQSGGDIEKSSVESGIQEVEVEKKLETAKEKSSECSEKFIEECKQEADDGSVDNQLFLGKHFLKIANAGHMEKDYETSVGWLIKASRQANTEATDLLKKCLLEGKGVNDANITDVQWCIETSDLEKNARVAAHKLFQVLNPLHKDLSSEAYLQEVYNIASTKEERKLLEKAGKLKGDERVVSEDKFVEKMVKRIQGRGGLTSLLTSGVEGQSYQTASWYQKVTQYPLQTVTYVGDYTVEFAAKQGSTWLRSLVPTQQIHMLLVFFLYSVISLHFLLRVFPLFVFYFSFLSMIICTLQMFYSRRKLRDVQALANMLGRFNQTLDSDTAESAYSWQSITPYFAFFGTLFATVLAFSLTDKSWVPCSELVALSMFFFGSTFVGLSNKYDILLIAAVICNLFSTLPAFFEDFPRIPVLYHIFHFIFVSVFSVEITPDIHVNLGIPSLMYMIVPFLFLRMAMSKSWQGTYRVLVPHLVCFFWWQISIMFFRHSTWLGLLRGSFGWITAIFLLPLAAMGFILWIVAYSSQILSISGFLKLLTTLLLLAVPAGIAFFAKSGLKGYSFSLEGKKGKVIFGVLSVFAVIPMMYMIAPPERDVGGQYLTWDQYSKYCSKPQWDQTNIAKSQVMCSHLKFMMVSWEGYVKKVVVKKIDNQAEGFVDLLPTGLGSWLKCTYGERYPPCDSFNDTTERELCEIQTLQGQECHMKALEHYTFELWVTMPLGLGHEHDIRIVARHDFKNTLMKLKTDDKVSFRASLMSELGNTWPVLKLYHVECTSCPEAVSSSQEDIEEVGPMSALLLIKSAIYSTLNFFVSPVIQFG